VATLYAVHRAHSGRFRISPEFRRGSHARLAIFDGRLPGSGYEIANAPEIEVYGESFDRVSGTGGVEIRIPLKSGSFTAETVTDPE
jgi:DNA gyrase inhibitor GyrI